MTVLSDRGIIVAHEAGRINISPYRDELLQPCSIDVTLRGEFMRLKDGITIDPLNPPGEDDYEYFLVGLPVAGMPANAILPAGGFVLGTTQETVTVGAAHVATLHGKSSLARLGLQIHAAGLIDPGFSGQITLEIYNQSQNPILLTPGMRIGQLTFEQLDQPAANTYQQTGRYNGQTGVTISKGI